MQLPLPKGAKLLPIPITKQVGNWVRMVYDAKIVYRGITWLRVKRGIGGDGRREDWIADLPKCNISVHDYNYRSNRNFGFRFYRSFHAALLGESAHAIRWAKKRIKELEGTLKLLQRSVSILERSRSSK